MTRLRDVTISYRTGDEVRGWYIPSRNGATVILAHGSNSNRGQLATEARMLSDAGFGILAFDWPGHGESSGRVTYGPEEKDAFNAAVSFAGSRPEADPGRIGALGFSVGAALVALAAAGDTRIHAVVLVSPFADSDEETRYEFARWGPLMQWPALWVDRAFMPGGPLRPVDSVRALAGRALLIVAASDDPVVPSWMSKKVYMAARARKEFLVVPHAGHSGLDALAPGIYGDSIMRFFRDALDSAIMH
jgi:alpha-beta hydrolase superfamily lysophospholipase